MITDGRVPSHVLLTIEDVERMAASTSGRSLVEALRADDDVDVDPPRVEISARPVDL